MNKEDVLSILKTHPNGSIEEPQFKKKFPNLYQEIITWSFPEDFKFTQKLYHYFNDDPDLKLGLCPVCGKRCKFQKFNRGYKLHCCRACVEKDPYTLIKRKLTCQNRYGVENAFQSEEKKLKIKNTLNEKYGVEHPLQNKEIHSKMTQTCLDRYGVENYSSLQECREKVINTNLEKFGVENYSQTEEYKESVRKTSLEKYGVEHFAQSHICIKKQKETMLERYGVEHALQYDEFKEKAKETTQERYGVDYYSKTQECKNKMKQTCLDRFGVENFSQTSEWASRKQKRIDYNGLTFDSSWELIVYKYCEKNKIPCEYQPNITFEYICGDITHHYHPDFLIDGKLYEVKGEQFFDGDKMINPYDRTQDNLFEAKHQCMIKNGVIILRKIDIKKIKERLK